MTSLLQEDELFWQNCLPNLSHDSDFLLGWTSLSPPALPLITSLTPVLTSEGLELLESGRIIACKGNRGVLG